MCDSLLVRDPTSRESRAPSMRGPIIIAVVLAAVAVVAPSAEEPQRRSTRLSQQVEVSSSLCKIMNVNNSQVALIWSSNPTGAFADWTGNVAS